MRESFKRAGAASSRALARVRAPRRRVVGLCYHSVHPTASYASASPDLFEAHLAWLAESCDVIPFQTMLTAAQGPPRSRPAVAITFDDGYADNYEFAFPLLTKYGMEATFFVTAGLSDGDPAVRERFEALRSSAVAPLEWGQAREMHIAGMAFGSHTYSHPNLIKLGRDAVTRELSFSKSILEDRLAAPVDLLAYPFGKPGRQFDDTTVEVARAAGYTHAAAVLFRSVKPSDSPLALPRFFATRTSIDELAAKVRGDWDYLGIWQERAPRSLARIVSPQDFRF